MKVVSLYELTPMKFLAALTSDKLKLIMTKPNRKQAVLRIAQLSPSLLQIKSISGAIKKKER